jgi:hypothetical protein
MVGGVYVKFYTLIKKSRILMYTYLLIPVLLTVAVLVKYRNRPDPKKVVDIDYFTNKVEPYSNFNPDLYKEFIHNLKLFNTTQVVDYLNNAVKNIRDFGLYTDAEDFEEVFIDEITKDLLKQIDA